MSVQVTTGNSWHLDLLHAVHHNVNHFHTRTTLVPGLIVVLPARARFIGTDVASAARHRGEDLLTALTNIFVWLLKSVVFGVLLLLSTDVCC